MGRTTTIVIAIIAILLGLATPGHADEVTRIRTHLDKVRVALASGDVTMWSPAQQRNRRAALAALARYTERGVFPRRTGDHYVGRRPRFIDDRGVRCAVGELVAASGQPELAREIAATAEYAYVRDMKLPALAGWATAHGFTIEELALIQPSYESPPTASATRGAILEAKDRITLTCATAGPIAAKLELHVFGLTTGRVKVGTTDTTPFARCFVKHANKVQRGGAYDGKISTYDFELDLTINGPQVLLDAELDAIRALDECGPRPGAIARRASVDIASSKTGLAIHVATTPSNAEVDACVEASLASHLQVFHDIAKLQAHHDFALASPFEPGRVRQTADGYTRSYATDCYPATNPPAHVKVTIRANVDDPAFTIAVDNTDASFANCLADKLQHMLHDTFSVSRQLANKKYERYFRIDRDVGITVDVPVESPKVRQDRTDAMKKRREDEERRNY